MEHLELFKNYLLLKKLSPNTITSYLFDLSGFLKFEDFAIRYKRLTLLDFRKYFASRREEKIKSSSLARAISAIKMFYLMLAKYEICINEEIKKVTPPKLPKTLPKALDFEEICLLLDLQEDEDWVLKRNKALIILLYATGMRISEALSLNRKDFIKSADFIKVKGKGGKERIIPLIQKAKDEIEEYIKICPTALLPDYPLFVTEKRGRNGKPKRLSPREAQQFMQNERIKKDLPKFATPHALRHSFASHIIQKGGDLRSVQGLLGHASLSTTQKYTKIDERTMKEAYKKFHPKG